MAVDSSFDIVTQTPTVEFLGGTKTRDVIAVGFVTNAHQVYGEARVPQSSYGASLARAACVAPATIFETLFTIDGVIGVGWSQDVNDSGLLVDEVTITVSSVSGDSSGQIGPTPMNQLGPQLHGPQIAALRKELSDAEGQSG